MGAETMHVVRIEYQEFGDDRHRTSLKAARDEAGALAGRLAARTRPSLQGEAR